MIATVLVRFYLLWHGRLKLPGAGLLLRLSRHFLPKLRDYPLAFPGSGTARLDFRDQASFSLLNYKAGDWGNHGFLFQAMAIRGMFYGMWGRTSVWSPCIFPILLLA